MSADGPALSVNDHIHLIGKSIRIIAPVHGHVNFAIGIKLYAPFSLTPEKGARTTVYLASSPEVANVTGAYFAKCKQKTPSANARDDEAAEQLWQVSEALIAEASPA